MEFNKFYVEMLKLNLYIIGEWLLNAKDVNPFKVMAEVYNGC